VTVITFVTYPSICIKDLEMFDCSIEIDGKKYLTAEPTQECWTSSHVPYVLWAVVMLVGFCIGAPLVALIALTRWRKNQSPYFQLVLRFLYDGFKPKQYFWEVLILLRKLLIAVFIILFRNNVLHQIYGMMYVIQAGLVLHILFHPYTSGRQFKLETWSLLSILVTLFVSLYIVEESNNSFWAYFLSACVMILNLLVILGFVVYIGRGLMRRFMKKTWLSFSTFWQKHAPQKLQKKPLDMSDMLLFFQTFLDSSDLDKSLLYVKLDSWWKATPTYKRRRLMSVLKTVSKGTVYEDFYKTDDDVIELHELQNHD